MILADGTTIVDEYDPDLGILLGQDLDYHFNRFQIAFCLDALLFSESFLTLRITTMLSCTSSAQKHRRQISSQAPGMREGEM